MTYRTFDDNRASSLLMTAKRRRKEAAFRITTVSRRITSLSTRHIMRHNPELLDNVRARSKRVTTVLYTVMIQD